MTQTRQYANLTDLDDAPDIYETPELTDDTSTVPASTTVRSPSSASSYDDAQTDVSGIDRSRVQADEARSRFEPARVNARDVDFSDRLNRQRRSYRISSRRRKFADDAEEIGDLSDEEEETVEHRLARLRQEIEEVKAELAEKDGGSTEQTDSDSTIKQGSTDQATAADLQKLSDLLDSVYANKSGGSGAEAHYATALDQFRARSQVTPDEDAQNEKVKADITQDSGISVEQRAQILSKASEFDQRLASLEQSLGLDGSTLPDSSTDAQRPVLHTLNNLDRQLAMLSSTSSTEMLDNASHRVRQLAQEADRLAERQQPSSPTASSTLASSRDAKTNGVKSDEPEGSSKINALYGTLPTIESLAPSLPMVLERLRTLRLIHASASDASTTLEELERRQAEQAAEIERWREALQKVESSMTEGEGVLTSNVKVVGEWVKELEARVGKLNGPSS